LRDPCGCRRRRQGAVHHHGRAGCRRERHGRGERGLLGAQPAGVRAGPQVGEVTQPPVVPPSFGIRLRAALDAHGPLCVGIDPHAALLEQWGLSQNADGVRSFGLAVVDAAAGRVGVVKPQVAFFERFGSKGFAALEDVISHARKAGLLVLADAKRGDIGSTMAGYASAWLAPGAPLESDAVTVSPYLGPESLRETI